jgi:hypothetical protein
MATLISKATGLFTDATTWALCSAASELDSETTSTAITNINLNSNTFQPEANTINAIVLKVASIIAPTGTLTVSLNNSGGQIFAVTINCSDLQSNARGWHVFVPGTTHTPTGTDATYFIQVVRSVADSGVNKVSFFASSGNNFSRNLRTTTTQAPASGDKLIMAGEFTGAGTSNSFTVTLNNTATTSFGPTVSGGPPQGITINDKCNLQLQSSASTNYYLKWKGVLAVYAGGQLLLDTVTAITGSISGASNTGSTGRIYNSTNASPISINSLAHGLSTGNYVKIQGVLGNTAANGVFQITVVDSDNFTLNSSTGNGIHKYLDLATGIWIAEIAITSTAHGLSTGDMITVTGVQGNVGANGAWFVTVIDANNFILDGSVGSGSYTSGGTWVKRSALVSSSTCVLEMDSATNVDSGLEIWNDGQFVSFGASKTTSTTVKQSTVIGSDTNSIGSLVTTSGSTITWVEGAKFNTSWASDVSKTFTLLSTQNTGSQTTYTISSVPSTTSIVATASITTGASVSGHASSFAYTGTSTTKALPVEDTTGWASGDTLALSTSSSYPQDNETVTISTVDSTTQITATTGFIGYHSGLNDVNGDVRSTVVNLTRNIKIRGVSTSLQGYVLIAGNSNTTGHVAIKYSEFYQLGSTTTLKDGISIGLTNQINAAGVNFQYCSFHDFIVNGSQVIARNITGANCPLIKNCCFWNIATSYYNNVITSSTWIIDSCIFINKVATNTVTINDVGGIFTNNVIAGSGGSSTCIIYSENFVPSVGIFTGNSFTAGGNVTWNINRAGFNGVIGDGSQNLRIWRCLVQALTLQSIPKGGPTIIDGLLIFGCFGVSTINGQAFGTNYLLLRNVRFEAGANIFGGSGIVTLNNTNFMLLDNCTFGQTTAFNNDLFFGGNGQTWFIIANNTKWSNFTPSTIQYAGADTLILSMNHNQVAGSIAARKSHSLSQGTPGFYDQDTVRYHNSPPSLKVTSALTNSRLQTPKFNVAVASGSSVTPSVYVRKSQASSGDSADYNGRQPRLKLLANPIIGIPYDVIIATSVASLGTWELLTGTTASFTGSGVAQFVVDCDGTAGFINVDDFSCSGEADPKGFGYWGVDSLGPLIADIPSSGSISYVINQTKNIWLTDQEYDFFD